MFKWRRHPFRRERAANSAAVSTEIQPIDLTKPPVGECARFYRVILTADHMRRWNAGDYHSFHGNNGLWWKTWQETASTSLDDYPLGAFSHRARAEFIRIMRERGPHARLSESEQRLTTEFSGICAFDNPDAAFEYGERSHPPAPTVYVEFWGIRIGDVPEDAGVVAHVIEPIGEPMAPLEFKRKHELQG